MSLNTKPPDYFSMTRGQLELTLQRVLYLKNSKSEKLPDSGKKLDESIKRIISIIESKSYKPTPIDITPMTKLRSSTDKFETPLTFSDEAVVEEESEGCHDITTLLDSLKLSSPHFAGSDSEDELDFSKVPNIHDSLTPDAINYFRRLCKLPCIAEKNASYHAFVFQLTTINCGLVQLAVVDCLNPGRRLVKHGAASTWDIGEPIFFPQTSTSKRCTNTTTAASGPSMAELWRFIQSEKSDRPVLVAESARSLLRLRRLYCSTSVRHYKAAKDGLPRNVLFGVASVEERKESSNKDETGQEHPNDIPEDDILSNRLKECTLRYASLDAVDLAKMKPKTVVWIEAPINLQALRAIALVPRDPIVSHPPYAPPRPDFPNPWLNSTPSVSDHSSPMLKSVDNKLILRLAAAGFNPTSLTNLAGQGHWEGFAGLLASTGVSMCPKALSTLYQHFRRVHRGLKLNSELYREEASKPSSSPLWCPQSRQLKTLSLAESLEVMTRSCDSKRAEQNWTTIKITSTGPPPSALLMKYREQQDEDSDDTLCGDDNDDS